MNKIGIFFAYWSREWEGDFKYYINKAANLGFDILEVITPPFLEMSDLQIAELRKLAVDRGIEITYCAGFSLDKDIASEDAAIRKNGIEYAKRTLEMINKMGGSIFSGINYSAWHATLKKHEHDKMPHRARSINSIKEIMKTADDFGIMYCMEVVNRFEQYLLNTAAEGVSYIQEVGNPNLKLLLDTFHMNIEEDNIAEAILYAGENMGHLHVGECNRKPVGKGNNIRWKEVFSALKTMNYKGRIVLEPFVKIGGQVGNDISIWRDTSNYADEATMDLDVKNSLEFVRRNLG